MKVSRRVEERTSPRTENSDPIDADVVLVVVHGMGQSLPASTLLEWAEPILGRIDWLTKYADVIEPGLRKGESDSAWSPGATVVDSVLSGAATPHIVATAQWSATSTADDGSVTVRKLHRTIAVLEARWSESFVPMTRSEVFNWGARFLWRALWYMFKQFTRTLVKVPGFGTSKYSTVALGNLTPRPPRSLPRRLFSGVLAAFGVALSIAVGAVLLGVGAILTLILPILSPLMLIPFVKKHVQNLVDAVVAYVGDVGTWRQRPLRAAAMRDVVQDRIVEANGMLASGGEIVVLAHSEGAAISAETLFTDMAPLEFNVAQLHTVGAANTLLGVPGKGFGSPRSGRWVHNWSKNSTLPNGGTVQWHNYWAIWDPFAAGPLGDTADDRSKRWKGSYVLFAGDSAFGPAEHAVHNTSLPLTDHQSYSANVMQVIDPVARVLLGAEFLPRATDADNTSVQQSVLIRRSRGLNLICSIVIAVMLPLIPQVQAATIAVLKVIFDGVNRAVGALAVDARIDLSSILNADGTRLGLWPNALAIALAAALLIWLNSLYANAAERSAVWDRLAAEDIPRWYRRELLVRSCYALAAAFTVAFVVAAPSRDMSLLPGLALGLGLGIIVLCVLIAPNLGALPFIVAEHPDPAASEQP